MANVTAKEVPAGNAAAEARRDAGRTVFSVLAAVSFCHFLNDMLQSMIPAVYPILKAEYRLDFGQIGLITLASQLTASVLQPVVGLYTDRRPLPYSLAVGMCFTFAGMVLLSVRAQLPVRPRRGRLRGARFGGLPPRVVAGGAHGVRRAIRAGAVVLPGGRERRLGARAAAGGVRGRAPRASAAWRGSRPRRWRPRWCWPRWAGGTPARRTVGGQRGPPRCRAAPPRARRARDRGVLVALVVSKYLYLASLSSYYTFFLIERFHVSVRTAQLLLFLFLGRGGGRHVRGRAHRRPGRAARR